MRSSVLSKILKFAKGDKNISVKRLRTLTLTNKNTPMKIWGTTLDGEIYNGREENERKNNFHGIDKHPVVCPEQFAGCHISCAQV